MSWLKLINNSRILTEKPINKLRYGSRLATKGWKIKVIDQYEKNLTEWNNPLRKFKRDSSRKHWDEIEYNQVCPRQIKIFLKEPQVATNSLFRGN